ncbi:MAG: protein-glutamate O-methyltransferase CheR [Verrucomicrobiales bacterium]|nr:protein-glutamate O-methyltransferase CheR [Verrucomicrobiales bacterium]
MAEFARTNAAIVLESGKEYLVESRLSPIARQQGHESLDAFVEHLRSGRAPADLRQIVLDALTTNETSFFRDFHPFETLKKEILPRIVQERAAMRKLTVWSAASSTGQEAYTIAMVIREHFPQLRDWTVNIIGTDLSSAVLKQAQDGRYSQLEVNRGLPAPLLIKYFAKDGDRWKVKDDLRKMVDFRPMNLVQPWPVLPPFDVIFIRNVMIYFDVETKKGILRKMRACMMPHSVLFLGTAETTVNLDVGFDQVSYGNTAVYRVGAAAKKP